MKQRNQHTTEQIDQLLPQTQCGLCGYNGCKPYAQAIAHDDERIDLCLPGGVKTLQQLGHLLNEDVTALETDMAKKAKPPMKAVIREDECIGCTKCIQACPVDAIVGAAKHMHTVISDECTGCELCVDPCPVDCIDMIEVAESTPEQRQQQADRARKRYESRLQRDEKRRQKRHDTYQQAKLGHSQQQQTLQARKSAINAAVARAKAKKRTKQHGSTTY